MSADCSALAPNLGGGSWGGCSEYPTTCPEEEHGDGAGCPLTSSPQTLELRNSFGCLVLVKEHQGMEGMAEAGFETGSKQLELPGGNNEPPDIKLGCKQCR